MKVIKKINRCFDGIWHDIRLFNPKISLIFCIVTLLLGIFTWLVGGSCNTVMLIYIFPRGALGVGIMYLLWFISFAFVGLIIGGVFCGCEKFKRREATKVAVLLLLSYLFTLCIYPTFFKALAPFVTFLILACACVLCLISILAAKRIFCLWTVLLILHLLWLFYNCYISLVFALIN